jgi:hypothetical protein
MDVYPNICRICSTEESCEQRVLDDLAGRTVSVSVRSPCFPQLCTMKRRLTPAALTLANRCMLRRGFRVGAIKSASPRPGSSAEIFAAASTPDSPTQLLRADVLEDPVTTSKQKNGSPEREEPAPQTCAKRQGPFAKDDAGSHSETPSSPTTKVLLPGSLT